MDTKVSSMRNDLSFVLRFLFLLSTRIFLSSRFSSLGQRVRRQHVDRHASHSVVHSGLFDENFVYCQKTDLFFLTYKNIILFKLDAFSLVSGVLAWSLYILIGQLATMLEYRVVRCHARDNQMHPTLIFTCPLCC